MGKLFSFLLISFASLFNFHAKGQPPLVAVFDYIDTYSGIAVEQMTEHGIPASVILAQAIFESGSGTSALAKRSNNHFGIKCHLQWTGDTAVKTDDTENECFRKYVSIRESYADHSHFLSSRKRYSHLFKIPLTDYHSWCWGIKKAGYATFPTYAEELIRIIDRYQLYRLDRPNYLHPVSLQTPVARLKESSLNASQKELNAYANNGLLWLNENDIHIRSLDMILEESVEEMQLLADNAKKF